MNELLIWFLFIGLMTPVGVIVLGPPVITVLAVANDRLGIGSVMEAYDSYIDYWIEKEREWKR